MNRYLLFLNILLLTAAVYFGVNTFYQVATARLEPGPTPAVDRKETLSTNHPDRQPFSNYQTIIDRNLFNTRAGAGQKPKAVDIETLKQTELELKLWGTVTGEGGRPYAVIEDRKQRKQSLYRTGDTIQNARVKMVLREKVILTVNGKDEILQMEEMSASRPSRRETIRRGQTRALPPRASRSITLERSVMENAAQNLNNLMKQVRIRPHFKAGKPDGLSLTGMKPGSVFRKMGLHNGDIIMGVDGKTITSVDDALRFYETLKSASDLKLQIQRRGRPLTLNYNFE